MKTTVVLAIVGLSIGAGILRSVRVKAEASEGRTPILVELFTSEGCSSCPSADRLLEQFDRKPIAGAELIVLSEHVDYWNQIGWKDPYSQHFFSDRQSTYGQRFGLDSIYTPQMVVDGTTQFVGSDSSKASKAFAGAIRRPKIPVHLSTANVDASGGLQGHIEVGKLESSLGLPEAEVHLALALNHAESQVLAGENAGHKLAHTAVVKSLTRIGVLKQGKSMAKDIQLKLDPSSHPNNFRLIAFVQAVQQGPVVGAAEIRVVSKE